MTRSDVRLVPIKATNNGNIVEHYGRNYVPVYAVLCIFHASFFFYRPASTFFCCEFVERSAGDGDGEEKFNVALFAIKFCSRCDERNAILLSSQEHTMPTLFANSRNLKTPRFVVGLRNQRKKWGKRETTNTC